VRLTRLYVERELAAGSLIDLPADAATHVARVLRARSGDALVLFNGDGTEFDAVIETVRGSRVTAAVGGRRQADRESPLAVTLIQCVPRGDRMDLIVQKTVELGVAEIVPVVSQRGVVRLDNEQSESKRAHWHAIAVSACEQCGRNRVPRVARARPLLEHLAELAPAGAAAPALATRRWVLEPESPRAVGRDENVRDIAVTARIEIAIGPEGGFAADELEAFRIAGFAAIGLGPRVLRTETAAIAALAWLQSSFGDM
jgi:16S rRNA (uracil1498-N3)-methyltransferase